MQIRWDLSFENDMKKPRKVSLKCDTLNADLMVYHGNNMKLAP
jgi:hypothetical protein